MERPFLVLDANILIRSVLGRKVLDMLLAYYEQVIFLVPDVCMKDAEKYLPNKICQSVRGLVKSNSIVPLLNSSAKERIVMAGISNRKR